MYISRGVRLSFKKKKIFFTFTNSVDPDEMQHYAAFHLGLHCLQKYSLSRIQRVNVHPSAAVFRSCAHCGEDGTKRGDKRPCIK